MACATTVARSAGRRQPAAAAALHVWAAVARPAAVSACLVAPCFWQTRIQAGDLASHLYTAWLGNLAVGGKLSGIGVAPQFTNVLFDLAASWLLRIVGGQAERLAVSAAVLVFFWGAFWLASAAARRRPWFLAPVLAMLAYGWVFRAGFFNFYIGLGFGFAALALVIRRVSPARLAGAAGLLAVATTAHIMAAGWAAGACLFALLAHRLNSRRRWMLAGFAVAALFWVGLICSAVFVVRWTPLQLVSLTGAEQLWVYSSQHYLLPTLGLVLVWTLLAVRRLEEPRSFRDAAGTLAPLVVITSAAVVVLPDWIQAPGVEAAFSFLAYRTSLAAAVLITAAVAGMRPTRAEMSLIVATTAAFFAASYYDTGRLNQIEDRIQAVVRTLPPGQRVLNGLCWPEGRIDPAIHMLDRACMGRCFSYAGYEPSSKQFRVRAWRPNPYVLSTRREVSEAETGQYRVGARDLPLYQLEWRGSAGEVGLRRLRAGEVAGRTCPAEPPES